MAAFDTTRTAYGSTSAVTRILGFFGAFFAAVEVAQANVDANNLSGRVACVEAAGFDHPQLAEAAPFDLVFANILKGPLVALAPDMAGALQPAGYAILSGLLNEQADEVIEVYARSGIKLVHRESIGDWTTLTLQTNG